MNEFCAAMGICNLRHIDRELQKRKQVVEVLRKIRNNCIKRNEETIIKCQKQLNAKIIRKLLRNK